MTRYYSRSRGGFFDSKIHGAKGAKGSRVPKDAVVVDQDAFDALFAAQAAGQRIVAGTDGWPVAIAHVPSPEDQLARLLARRDRDLADSDRTQVPDYPISAEQRQAFAEWRRELREFGGRARDATSAGIDPSTIPYPVRPG